MIAGLQTNIEAWVPQADLEFCYERGARIARIAAMHCSTEVMAQMIDMAEAVGFRPYITIADPERMRIRPGRDYECRNEDDGDMSPYTYRSILDRMSTVALQTGCRLWGPTYSNTDRDSTRWAQRVKGEAWPVGMFGLSVHSYDPHENTMFRELEELAGGLPICVSEFGYPSFGISEHQQADKLRELWKFYADKNYYAALLYQIYDGPANDEHYGIKRYPWTPDGWKPAAYTFPKTEQGGNDMAYELPRSVGESQVRPVPDGSGRVTVDYEGNDLQHRDPSGNVVPKPAGLVTLSVQPDGTLETRNLGTVGEYEVATRKGDILTWKVAGIRRFMVVSGE